MVDVTVDNFEDALRRLRTLVPQCDFVAIDLEFTGLDHDAFGAAEGGVADAAEPGASGAAGAPPSAPTGAAAEQPAPFDLRKEAQAKYAKLRDATEFLVVQVGVCPFVFKQKSQSWLASPFNFYVFPCEFRGIDRRFMCQTRCMQFLANNSLDFNKLFKSGVPFLNHQEEELIRKSGGKDAAFIESTRTSIVDFICDASQQSMVLPPADGFHRMLIYRELTDIFSDVLVHQRASLDGEMRVRINRTQRTSSLGATREAVEAAVQERARVVNELQLNSAVGFRHVMDLLASTHKPLVGHNMLLDMMQVEAHFHRDLPPELSKFKASLHHRFPTLVDTKHLLAAAPQSLARHFTLGSRLDMVFKTVCGDAFKTPKVELANGFTRYLHKRHHEAGFDAYMTGVVYVRLAQELVKTVPSSSTTASPGLSRQASGLAHTGLTPRLRDLGPAASAASQRAPAHLDTLCSHGYCNKLHVMGCSRIAYIDFDGGMDREISPLGDWPEFGLSSPKRGRALSQDMDTSLEHEEALRRGPALAESPVLHAKGAVTPPHAAALCVVARHRVRDALENGSAKKPKEKRPRMSL